MGQLTDAEKLAQISGRVRDWRRDAFRRGDALDAADVLDEIAKRLARPTGSEKSAVDALLDKVLNLGHDEMCCYLDEEPECECGLLKLIELAELACVENTSLQLEARSSQADTARLEAKNERLKAWIVGNTRLNRDEIWEIATGTRAGLPPAMEEGVDGIIECPHCPAMIPGDKVYQHHEANHSWCKNPDE